MPRARALLATAILMLAPSILVRSAAQQRGGRVDAGVERLRAFDSAAVERGRTVFGEKCSSCHRANARGGQGFSGPDLIRSVRVLQDAGGKQLGEYLSTGGHPDRTRPAIALTAAQLADMSTFLHREITYAAERTNYQIQYVMTGDAAAGEKYFKGAGGCQRCHSPEGDLKGIGARYAPPQLQTLIVFGTIGGRGRGDGAAPRLSRKATITLPSGETVTGTLVHLTDFDVTIRDDNGRTRSWLRDRNTKVQVIDPLQGHLDLLAEYTDADIHHLAAYLSTLK